MFGSNPEEKLRKAKEKEDEERTILYALVKELDDVRGRFDAAYNNAKAANFRDWNLYTQVQDLSEKYNAKLQEFEKQYDNYKKACKEHDKAKEDMK